MRTAVLLAGRRPGPDPLAVAEGVGLKVLIPVAGEPMVVRVARTLLACPSIGAVRVLTQDIADVAAVLPADPRLSIHRSEGGIAQTLMTRAGGPDLPWPLFVTTADHPLLGVETVEDFIARSADADMTIGMVEARVVHRRFPGNRRTWLTFRGGRWTGANLFALNGPAALRVLAMWSAVEQDRKKGWKLIARFGPVLLLRALTRTITIERAVAQAGRRLGARVRAVPLADPLAAVDVDKPSDLALAREVLAA